MPAARTSVGAVVLALALALAPGALAADRPGLVRTLREGGVVLVFRHAATDFSKGLPGAAQPYAVYVDGTDVVWLTDFGRSALVRFDPRTSRFTTIRLRADANVRQLLGRPGEVWGAESGSDRLVVVRS